MPHEGRRQSHKVKTRMMGLDGCSCHISTNLDLFHHGTSGPKRCLFLASKLKMSPWLPEHLELTAAKLRCAAAHPERPPAFQAGCWPATTSPELGEFKPHLLGARSYGETAALTCVPFFSQELSRAHSSSCFDYTGSDLRGQIVP